MFNGIKFNETRLDRIKSKSNQQSRYSFDNIYPIHVCEHFICIIGVICNCYAPPQKYSSLAINEKEVVLFLFKASVSIVYCLFLKWWMRRKKIKRKNYLYQLSLFSAFTEFVLKKNIFVTKAVRIVPIQTAWYDKYVNVNKWGT